MKDRGKQPISRNINPKFIKLFKIRSQEALLILLESIRDEHLFHIGNLDFP